MRPAQEPRFGRILALCADPKVTSHTRELGAAAAVYGVPFCRDLDAIVMGWGPAGRTSAH